MIVIEDQRKTVLKLKTDITYKGRTEEVVIVL